MSYYTEVKLLDQKFDEHTKTLYYKMFWAQNMLAYEKKFQETRGIFDIRRKHQAINDIQFHLSYHTDFHRCPVAADTMYYYLMSEMHEDQF